MTYRAAVDGYLKQHTLEELRQLRDDLTEEIQLQAGMKTTPCPRCDGAGTLPDYESLRPIRLAAGLSLGQLSKLCGLSVPYLSEVERGTRNTTPRIREIYTKLKED